MTPSTMHKVALATLLVITLVGAGDAAVGGVWDHVAVFVLAAGLQLLLLLELQGRRPAVPLRADLVAWLRHRASETGEPMELVADRCIATARADLDRR
jgi:hypothetical protein